MRNTLYSLMLASSALTVASCGNPHAEELEQAVKEYNAANRAAESEVVDPKYKHYSKLDSNTVKFIQLDPINADVNNFSQEYGLDKNYPLNHAAYYYNMSDSSVVISRRMTLRDNAGVFTSQSLSDPILYKDMEKSVRQNFDKAAEYITQLQKPKMGCPPKLNGPK